MIIKTDANNLDWVKQSVQNKGDIPVNANTTENIGVNLVTRYLLPFEAISILLMIALVGAAHLSRKGRGL
jgi:NADH-quinone oxidoreductase subunit J